MILAYFTVHFVCFKEMVNLIVLIKVAELSRFIPIKALAYKDITIFEITLCLF